MDIALQMDWLQWPSYMATMVIRLDPLQINLRGIREGCRLCVSYDKQRWRADVSDYTNAVYSVTPVRSIHFATLREDLQIAEIWLLCSWFT
jgi:hypothetical protein